MSENTLERSRLDAETFTRLRMAALASVGAPAASYAANRGAADEFGVNPEKVQGCARGDCSRCGHRAHR